MKVKQVLTDNLDLDAENIVIQRPHRVGSKKSGKSRSIVAKFQSYKDKEKIFQAKRKLKGSGVYIRESHSFSAPNQHQSLHDCLFSKMKKKSLSTSKI